LKELLKQYQNFNKRLICSKKGEDSARMPRNHSQKLLSDRHFSQVKSTTSYFEEHKEEKNTPPSEYYQLDNQEQK
jgi:hypothetical protein